MTWMRWLAVAGLVLLVVIALAAAGLWLTARSFDRTVARHVRTLRATPSADAVRDDLPPLLARFVARAGGPAPSQMRWLRIEQRGEMRLSPDAPWQPFHATQHYAVARPAFVWHARLRMSGLPVTVLDRFDGTHGELTARLLGAIPVATAAGPATDTGELMRYLAELPWVPHAIAALPDITWTPLDARRVRATLRANGVTAEVVFTFDEQGDIVGMHADARPRSEAPGDAAPWGGAFRDYRELGGVRMPTHGRVWWELPDGRFVYWRGTVTAVQWERGARRSEEPPHGRYPVWTGLPRDVLEVSTGDGKSPCKVAR